MYKVYITDYKGKQEQHLFDCNTREEASNYILNTIKLGTPAYSILFVKNYNVAKVFNVTGLHYANYIIKEVK